MQFGFAAGNRISNTYTQLYDNWSLTTTPVVPEPSTFFVWFQLGALGLGYGWYRRRKAG